MTTTFDLRRGRAGNTREIPMHGGSRSSVDSHPLPQQLLLNKCKEIMSYLAAGAVRGVGNHLSPSPHVEEEGVETNVPGTISDDDDDAATVTTTTTTTNTNTANLFLLPTTATHIKAAQSLSSRSSSSAGSSSSGGTSKERSSITRSGSKSSIRSKNYGIDHHQPALL